MHLDDAKRVHPAQQKKILGRYETPKPSKRLRIALPQRWHTIIMDLIPRNGYKVVMLMMACLLFSALSARASIASSLAMDNAASTLLLQGKRVTGATPDKLTQYVIAVKKGDVEKRKDLIVLFYFEIGCGGKNRNRKPSELILNGLLNAQYDEQFIKYGVVDTYTKILADAYTLVLDRPPSKSDCDKWYKSGRKLL